MSYMLIDLNQVLISNLMQHLKHVAKDNVISEDLVRHMCINTIRSNVKQFKAKYPNVILCCDNKHYWRRDFFPFYKSQRKHDREASGLDWGMIFDTLNKIKDDLKEYFPYRVIDIESAEADDIIATLIKHHYTEEKILILSGDKDFIQLHTFNNVKQFDPVRKKWISHNDPNRYLDEHILKGDTGDGIPNVLSADNCFVVGERQKPLTQKKIDALIDLGLLGKWDHPQCRNFMRNRSLIDLSLIPLEIEEKINQSYESQSGKSRDKMFNYFIANKLKHLMENIQEF